MSLYQTGYQPAGIRKAWDRSSMAFPGTEKTLGPWLENIGGKVTDAVAWFDADDRLKVLVADGANGKRIIVRVGTRGWKITFEQASQ